MKKRGLSRRLLSVLLALVMLLSLLPTAVFAATPKATLVTDASTLKAGDQIILAASANGKTYAVGNLSGKLFTSIETDPTDPAENVEIFTLGGEAGKWTLTTSGGKQIYTKQAKALNDAANGTGTWTIDIDASGLATVASTDTACGRILYNVNAPRFMNYTSATNVSMLLPSIYRLEVTPARQSGIISDLSMLQDGDTVVVFNPKFGKTLSTEYNGFYNMGTDVTLTDGKLTGFTDADKWTLGINADGTYTFSTADGKKLAMGAKYTSTPLDEVNPNWKITAVEGKDATFYIDNATRTDKYRLQWYAVNNNWSAYTGTGDAFELQLYLVIETDTPDTPGTPDTPTAPLKDGDQVVIYNPANLKALSTEYTGYYNKGTDVTLDGGKLAGFNDADIWTVGVNADGSYTFSTADGKKLSMGTSYGSTPLDDVNTAWQLEEAKTAGCYYIKNTVRGNYLEWYADKGNWSSFSKISDEALFAQAFFKVKESGIVTSLSAGDTVVIFNPANLKALSTDYAGTYYNQGTAVTIADGKLSGYTKADIWTVGVNADGSYTFSTADGKKLSMGAKFTSTPLDDVNTAWQLEKAATSDCFYIKNTVRGNYLEWYADKGNWSSYYKVNDEALFAQQFYLVADDGSDTPSDNPLAPGSKVVIYNANAGAALAKQDDNAESPSITKAAATIADGKLTTGNGAAVFTVEANGEYLRFYNESYGYLCANGTGNNAFYSKTASNDADWLVRTCSGGVGGYEMESRTAKYKGYSQWLEYYSDSFKVYSMNKATVTDYTIYSFDFYPVAEGVNVIDGIVNAPCIVLGTLPPAYVGQDYEFGFSVDAPFGVSGDMTATLGDKSLNVTKGEDGKYSVTIPKAMISGDKLTVVITGKDNKGVDISSKVEIDVVDAPSIANPLPAERSETGDNKRPTIGATIINAGNEPAIELTVNEKAVKATYENGKVSYTPDEDMADGRVNVQLTVTRKDGKSATLNWYFIVGKAQYQLYFGQLHSHTQYSDGSGTLDSALDYVKNLPESANVQFVAFTDHSNYFDTTSAANPEGALYDTSLATAYS